MKVTELADGQTLSFKLPSMVMGERVLRAVTEPVDVEGVGIGVGVGVVVGVGVGVGVGVEIIPLPYPAGKEHPFVFTFNLL